MVDPMRCGLIMGPAAGAWPACMRGATLRMEAGEQRTVSAPTATSYSMRSPKYMNSAMAA